MDEATLVSDEELIATIRSGGDPGSLDQLIQRHLPTVRSTVFQMTCDDAAADDLTQEVVFVPFEGWPGSTAGPSFRRGCFAFRKIPRSPTSSDSRGRATPPRATRPIAWPGDRRRIVVLDPGIIGRHRAGVGRTLADAPSGGGADHLQGLSPTEAAEIEECSASTMYWCNHEERGSNSANV